MIRMRFRERFEMFLREITKDDKDAKEKRFLILGALWIFAVDYCQI